MLKVRDTIHLDFDRDGDLLLDFLGRPPWPLRDYLHPCIGDVWIGFDRQVVKRDHAPNEEKNRHAEDNKAIVQSEIDDRANHCCSAEFWNARAFATIGWPGVRPETTSCMEFGSMSPPTTSVRRN